MICVGLLTTIRISGAAAFLCLFGSTPEASGLVGVELVGLCCDCLYVSGAGCAGAWTLSFGTLCAGAWSLGDSSQSGYSQETRRRVCPALHLGTQSRSGRSPEKRAIAPTTATVQQAEMPEES
jgi:hypothetical protein